jgi:hypothetical protein
VTDGGDGAVAGITVSGLHMTAWIFDWVAAAAPSAAAGYRVNKLRAEALHAERAITR